MHARSTYVQGHKGLETSGLGFRVMVYGLGVQERARRGGVVEGEERLQTRDQQ